MIAKSVVYFGGRGLVELPRGRFANRTHDLLARANRWPNTNTLFLLCSAATGVPPFYVITIAAGTLRVPFARFFAVGLAGRIIRFAVLVALPQTLKAAV